MSPVYLAGFQSRLLIVQEREKDTPLNRLQQYLVPEWRSHIKKTASLFIQARNDTP
jgi:hypothetical protein